MSKFVFVYNVYKDFDDATMSIVDIKRHYPESKVIVSLDGTSNEGFEVFCKSQEVTVIHGKGLHNSKEWIKRWLQIGIDNSDSDDDWIVKMDTETSISGRLSRVPNCDVFGCFHSTKGGFKNWTLQGGAQFIRRGSARYLIDNQFLDSPIFDSDNYKTDRDKFDGAPNDSAIFTSAIKNAKLFVVDHPELFFCVGFPNNFNPSRYTMIHPYKWKDKWREPKSTKVFGIGLTKTGTLSTSEALKKLGYKSIHYPTNPLKQVHNFDALFDLPIACNYKLFDSLFPGSKFIFNIRGDEISWLRSLDYWYHEYMEGLDMTDWQRDLLHKSREGVYGIHRYTNGKDILEGRRNHIKNVKEYFKDRSEDILWFDLTEGDGWRKLCDFLGESIPDTPFPHKHNHKQDRKNYKYHWDECKI